MTVDQVPLLRYFMWSWGKMTERFPDLRESEPEQFNRICDPRTIIPPQHIEPRFKSKLQFLAPANHEPCYDPYNVCIGAWYCTAPHDLNPAIMWTQLRIVTNEHAIGLYLKRLRRNGHFSWPFLSTLVVTGAMAAVYTYLRTIELWRTMSSDEFIAYSNSPSMQLFESVIAYSSARTAVMEVFDIHCTDQEDDLSGEDLQYLHAIKFVENLHLMDMAIYRKDSVAAAVADKRHDELYKLIVADGDEYFFNTKTVYTCTHDTAI